MGSRVRAVAMAVSGAIALGATVIACGDDESAGPDGRGDAAAALERIRTDFDAGRVAAVCRTVAQPRCRELVAFLRERPAADGSAADPARHEPLGVRVAGDRATIRIALGGGIDGRVRMVSRGGEWKLAGIATRPDPGPRPWEPSREAVKTPLVCPRISAIAHRGRDAVRGGCAVRLRGPETSLVMLTAFGDFVVARCSLDFTINLSSNVTDVLADAIVVRGPGICRGTRRCADGETGLRYPWQGDLPRGAPSAGMRLRFDLCVNTPLGRVRGMWHYRLVRRDGEVLVRAYDHPVGESSIQLLGTWTADRDDFLRESSSGK